MTSRIDELIEARLAAAGVPPASFADEAEFFRRLSLDLNGCIPTVVQLRDYLDDDRPEKRLNWVDELMDGANNAGLYTRHFTNVWRRILLWSTPAQPAVAGSLEGWLTRQIEANTSYDQLVRAVLTDPGADAFFIANHRMPESLAARTTRLFLGVKLECVQCHNDRLGGSWKRQQFWEFAAFFAKPEAGSTDSGKLDERPAQRRGNRTAPSRIKIGNTETWAEGGFLDGSRPDWARGEPRDLLADWIVGPENPWFARRRRQPSLAPLVRLRPDRAGRRAGRCGPPAEPSRAARRAVAAIRRTWLRPQVPGPGHRCQSHLSAHQPADATRPGRPSPVRPRQVRGLSSEQFYDSLGEATGCQLAHISAADPTASRSYGPQARFLAEFEDVHESATEAQASIVQALMMMNGRLIEEATRPERSRTLAAVLGETSKTAGQGIEELYLAALSRPPRPEERDRLVAFVEARDRARALRDVLWTLLNSTEFAVNH